MGSRSSTVIYNAIAPAEVDQVIFDDKIANMPLLWFQIINYLLPSVVVVKTFVWRLTWLATASISNLLVSSKKWKQAKKLFEDQVESDEQVD